MKKYLIFLVILTISNSQDLNEEEAYSKNRKVMSCLSLVHSHFVNHNEKISILIQDTKEENKELVYDKILYSTITKCVNNISPAEVNHVYNNLMDVQGLENSSAHRHITIDTMKLDDFNLSNEEEGIKQYIQDENLNVLCL